MDLFTGLIDDARLDGSRPSSPDEAVDLHRRLTGGQSSLLRSVLVTDRGLADLDRRAGVVLPVTVVNTTGAGGLTSLAGRTTRHLDIVAVDSAIRDSGDPAGNVARIAAAARELDPEVTVNVVLPHLPGWEQLVAEVEAEGLHAVIGWESDPAVLAGRVEVLVEADLAFSVDRVPSAGALLSVLTVVAAVIDGEDPGAAETAGSAEGPGAAASARESASVAAVRGWDDTRAARVRRRLQSVRVADAGGLIDQLQTWDLLSPDGGGRSAG